MLLLFIIFIFSLLTTFLLILHNNNVNNFHYHNSINNNKLQFYNSYINNTIINNNNNNNNNIVITNASETILLDISNKSIITNNKKTLEYYKLLNNCERYNNTINYKILDHSNHIVNLSNDNNITLVCCNSTKGYITIALHYNWAKIGVEHFLYLVKIKYFNSKISLFRSLKNFLVQFGLSNNINITRDYKNKHYHLKDDYNWIPSGPLYRQKLIEVPLIDDSNALLNELILYDNESYTPINEKWVYKNITRYQKGYLAYAGSGINSRGNQFIIAYNSNLYLGGGSPWELPIGQLIGKHSYETINKWTTKYNEKPSQGKIMNRGYEYLEKEFPDLDYITSCDIIKENVEWIRKQKPII